MQYCFAIILYSASGFAGLMYEVMWLKELRLLFGNTTHAAATTFAAFFLGLAAGGHVFGEKSGSLRRPLRTYAAVEVGIASSALLYFVLRNLYGILYNPIYNTLAHHHAVLLGVKLLLGISLLFLPAFFMGGTFPIMAQYAIRNAYQLGKTGSVLYLTNTLGAVLGAFTAGFFLLPRFGFKNSYSITITITSIIALLSLLLDKFGAHSNLRTSAEVALKRARSVLDNPAVNMRTIRWLAFLSGFATLALEVLWTRMFAQVLQNSVYTFSLILATFISCLALGSGLAGLLMRLKFASESILLILLTASGLSVAMSSFIFVYSTDGLSYMNNDFGFTAYLSNIFGKAVAVMFVPGILAGSIFPFLFRLSEPHLKSAGKIIGNLAAINTTGAILGSLFAGFILLEVLGLWSSIRLLAMLYLITAIILINGVPLPKILKGSLVLGTLLFVALLDTSKLPIVKIDPVGKKESLLESWEGSSGVTAVIRKGEDLGIKVNNYYTIGTTGASNLEARQAHIPLLIHPRPCEVFFLGMGTGITAGASLDHPVENITVSELVPHVVIAAREYFSPYVNNLFSDQRVSIISEDGRNHLLGTNSQFDLIIADLFTPWKVGTGTLYTVEHYQVAMERLKEDGLFAQWLPLYQLTTSEFYSIARTMIEVFPWVTIWRGDFFVRRPIVMLLGHTNMRPLLESEFLARLRHQSDDDWSKVISELLHGVNVQLDKTGLHASIAPLMIYYCGNLTVGQRLFAKAQLNIDDRSQIEYQAPISHLDKKANEKNWFVGSELIRFFDQLLLIAPPDHDPILSDMGQNEFGYIRAGLALHTANLLRLNGNIEHADKALEFFKTQIPFVRN